jgi:DNA-binding GntR family transcriptional regulator
MADSETFPQGEAAFSRIKRAILQLEFRPGERISERRLEALLGASRTPVRAALLRLETEDLVRRDGNSWQVTPLDADEALEAFDFRCMIELESVRRAMKLGTRQDFDRLSDILTESESAEQDELFLPATAMFHVEIARITRNRFLTRSIIEVLQRLIRVRMLVLKLEITRDHAQDDHRAIAAAIRSGNVARATKLMKDHLAWTRQMLTEELDQRRKRKVLQGGGTTLL